MAILSVFFSTIVHPYNYRAFKEKIKNAFSIFNIVFFNQFQQRKSNKISKHLIAQQTEM